MDRLPRNGAAITLLAVTGLSHRQSYKDIFALTLMVFVVIAVYWATGVVRGDGLIRIGPVEAGALLAFALELDKPVCLAGES